MRPFVLLCTLSLYVLCLMLHAAIADVKPIALSVTPRVAFAPASIAIRIRIHPAPEDRWVMVVVDSGDYYRRSDFTIDGDRMLYSWRLPDLPAGEYAVLAAIGSAGQSRAADRTSVLIQGVH